MSSESPFFSVGKALSGRTVHCLGRVEDISKHIDSLFAQFNLEEMFCAFAIFEYLTVRALRRGDELSLFIAHGDAVYHKMLTEGIEDLKAQHGIVTSIDVCKFGRSLVNVEFSDF